MPYMSTANNRQLLVFEADKPLSFELFGRQMVSSCKFNYKMPGRKAEKEAEGSKCHFIY